MAKRVRNVDEDDELVGGDAPPAKRLRANADEEPASAESMDVGVVEVEEDDVIVIDADQDTAPPPPPPPPSFDWLADYLPSELLPVIVPHLDTRAYVNLARTSWTIRLHVHSPVTLVNLFMRDLDRMKQTPKASPPLLVVDRERAFLGNSVLKGTPDIVPPIFSDNQIRAFVHAEVDAEWHFNAIVPAVRSSTSTTTPTTSSLLRRHLAATDVGFLVRGWMQEMPAAAKLHGNMCVAGGAARAAMIQALRRMGGEGCVNIIPASLKDDFGDVDFWLDVAPTGRPGRESHVGWIAHVARRCMAEQQLPCRAPDGPILLHSIDTVMCTDDKRAQFCAWDSLGGHTCRCDTPHGLAASWKTRQTPIACFDMTSVQFALCGDWFSADDDLDQRPHLPHRIVVEGGSSGEEWVWTTLPPPVALCTRFAAYALMTGRAYIKGECYAAHWPFDGSADGMGMGHMPGAMAAIGQPHVWSKLLHRLLQRIQRMTERGHSYMTHSLQCYVGGKSHSDRNRRSLLVDPAEYDDAKTQSLDMVALRRVLALPGNEVANPGREFTRFPRILRFYSIIGAEGTRHADYDEWMHEEGYTSELSPPARHAWEGVLLELRRLGLI